MPKESQHSDFFECCNLLFTKTVFCMTVTIVFLPKAKIHPKNPLIRFLHDSCALGGGFLRDEWEFLESTLNLTDSNLFF